MRKEGSLKLVLAVLVIVLVCLVSLGGIYVKDKNISKNVLAEYVLGTDLDTKTIVKLDVQKDEENSSEETQEENTQNEEVVSENDIEQSGNNEAETLDENVNVAEVTTEEGQAENKENLYTLDNYKKSKKIIEERLRLAGVEQYLVRLDEQSGNIVIELPNDVSSYIVDALNAEGKTEIKISETGEVLGDNNSIKNFKVGVDDTYVSAGIGKIVTLDLEFSKDTINKFKELKNNYVAPASEDGTTTANNIEISIDGVSIYSSEELKFLEAATKGSLQLSFGEYTTDEDKVEAAVQYANAKKMLVKTENLKLGYNVAYEQAAHSNISDFGIKSVFAVILGIMLVYLLIKYKSQGLLAALSVLGFEALLLLAIRYTGIKISIASIVGIIGMLILQFIYLTRLLNNKKISSKTFTEKTLEFSKMLVPAFITSIILALVPALKTSILVPFGNISEMCVFGMVVFWGLILFELFNNVLTRAILTNAKNK